MANRPSLRDGATVDRLVAALTPVRPRSIGRDAAWLAAVAVAQLVVVILWRAPRDDMMAAMAGPPMWWKLAGCAATALAGAAALLVVLSPEARSRSGRRWMIAATATAAVAGLALAVAGSPSQSMHEAMNWREGLDCVLIVEIYALPMLFASLWLARRAAPARPRAAALAAGVASAGWGALLFVWWCPHDDPLYVLVWYGLAVAMTAGAAWLVLGRLLRW